MTTKRRKKRKSKSKLVLGKPGDIVLGRTNDGRKWVATIGVSGRLVNKVLEDW